MMTEVMTKVTMEGLLPFKFGDVPIGTAFTTECPDVYIKTGSMERWTPEGRTDVNAVNAITGMGTWFPDDRMISPYTEAVYRR